MRSKCRELDVAELSTEVKEAVVPIVTSLLDQVNRILTAENGKFPRELTKRWHKTSAFLSLGPPFLDQGWFQWGLLDCASQLAALTGPRMLGQGLLNRVEALIFDSVVPEFRWKAVSNPGLCGRGFLV